MSLHFLIIDDDKSSLEIYRRLLEKAGHTVTAMTSSAQALEQIINIEPDCVLCDLVMPHLDGFELFRQLREQEDSKQPRFIIVTGKPFETDRRRAEDLGVDGYFTKPVDPETFVEEILTTLTDSMAVEFWGVRGTLPVPGEKTARYGGNTSCVSLRIGKKHFFIFDAGTGLKELSNALVEAKAFPLQAKIFISHPHYDHISAFPFFVPLFSKGNEFEIFGTNQGEKNIEELLSAQMDCVYLPFTMNEFSAKLSFRNLDEEDFFIDDVYVQTLLLNHPGRCLGYRIQCQKKIFCYVTDNELYLEDSPHFNQYEVERLMEFIKEADVLVMDTTYRDEEYVHKVGWGHSSVSRVVEVADLAQVKLLCLFHHDPEQFDKDIDAKLRKAQALLRGRHSKMRCIAPKEGEKIVI